MVMVGAVRCADKGRRRKGRRNMSITPKTEHSPILPIGFHPMTLEQLREVCVGRFPDSTTRGRIMDGLASVIDRLQRVGIKAEIWVDGSFLTAKRDPQDSDIVLRIAASVYENGTEEQRRVLDWVGSNLKNDHYCDSYLFYVYPVNDERAALNDYNHALCTPGVYDTKIRKNWVTLSR